MCEQNYINLCSIQIINLIHGKTYGNRSNPFNENKFNTTKSKLMYKERYNEEIIQELKYLKWSYNSIRKNQGDHEVEICVADDFSDKDNTWEWCQEMMEKDPSFKAIRNEGPTRLGHTILYDN
jgi:hypothetical protein